MAAPTIPVRVGNRVVQVVVCWTQAKVDATLAYYEDGIVPVEVDKMDPSASLKDRAWLSMTAQVLEAKSR
jgi:hypothetical protein